MSKIYEAEELRNQIQNHSHYGKCLIGSSWTDYEKKRDELNSISSTYDKILSEKSSLISAKNRLKIKESEYNRYGENKSKEFSNKERQYQNEIDTLRRSNDNTLYNLRCDINYEQSREDNELNSINQDIRNINDQIYQENNNYNREVQNQKNYERQLIDGEYSNKINEYENGKKLEKKKFDIENEIKERQFKADTEVEMNELRNKAELVNKLISMIKKYS